MNNEAVTLSRIRALTWIVVAGLLISGITAIPLLAEVNWLIGLTGSDPSAGSPDTPGWLWWLMRIRAALQDVAQSHPFLFYGTDWLGFAHVVIAIAFVGALRDPVRNRWLFDFGLIACALVIPFALVFGGIRGIPVWWRLVDCSFGVLGALPLWYCRKWARELELRRVVQ